MAKIDTTCLPIPETVRETKQFADALQPGKTLSLTFEVTPDYSLILRAQSYAQKLAADRSGKNAVPVSVGGVATQPSPELCRAIGLIQTLESPEDPKDRYTFEEWVALSRLMPNAFADVSEWGQSVIDKGFGGQADAVGAPAVPNGYAAFAGDTSAPPPSTKPRRTPKSSGDKTP